MRLDRKQKNKGARKNEYAKEESSPSESFTKHLKKR